MVLRRKRQQFSRIRLSYISCEFLKTLSILIVFLCVVILCRIVGGYKRCLHHQSQTNVMKMWSVAPLPTLLLLPWIWVAVIFATCLYKQTASPLYLFAPWRWKQHCWCHSTVLKLWNIFACLQPTVKVFCIFEIFIIINLVPTVFRRYNEVTSLW
jgi:hypothetical protein